MAQGERISWVAVGGSTGEGHSLSRDEFKILLKLARESLGTDFPLVAGIIVNSTDEAIERGKMACDEGADVLQVTPVHYLFKPDDEAMVQHFREICDATVMPLLVYNVVPWAYLSPELLCRIMREVPGVKGVKQSAGDLKLMADLLEMSESEDLIFSAVDALLYPSFILKARGAIAAVLAALPGHCVELWDGIQKVTMKRLWNCIVNSWLFGMLVILRTFRRVSNMLRPFRDCLKPSLEDQCLKRDRKRVFGSKRRFRMLEY